MNDTQSTSRQEPVKTSSVGAKAMRFVHVSWMVLLYFLDRVVDVVIEDAHVIRREFELFAGTALVLIGSFSFHNGKNCDGNTADYLSCTRPSTFYYYSWFEVTLIVVGSFLIIVWFLRSRERGNSHS